jgi:hypothetical protein
MVLKLDKNLDIHQHFGVTSSFCFAFELERYLYYSRLYFLYKRIWCMYVPFDEFIGFIYLFTGQEPIIAKYQLSPTCTLFASAREFSGHFLEHQSAILLLFIIATGISAPFTWSPRSLYKEVHCMISNGVLPDFFLISQDTTRFSDKNQQLYRGSLIRACACKLFIFSSKVSWLVTFKIMRHLKGCIGIHRNNQKKTRK